MRKMVLAAEIANQLYNEPTFGHVKFMKLLYLCEEVGNMELMTNYQKFAAGPFDNKLINSVDAYFKKQKWFRVEQVNTNGYMRYLYHPDVNVDKYKHLYDGYFGNQQQAISAIIGLFRKKDTKHCEIVATLYFVLKKLRERKSIISEPVLLKEFYGFHPAKQQYPPKLVVSKKEWMENEKLIPA